MATLSAALAAYFALGTVALLALAAAEWVVQRPALQPRVPAAVVAHLASLVRPGRLLSGAQLARVPKRQVVTIFILKK